ncbi:MAG: YbaK/EbsC family protein [Sphingomonadales bacterium]|nr:MAG: YbaK/EbsC family protein [Sphingomonadales bacterium]
MTVESARTWLGLHAPELRLIEGTASTATVADAAAALGVEPARIAKTLALRVGETVLLVVVRGDARLDNQKSKAEFGGRPKMLDADAAEALTGHPVGGVCPFGLASDLPVYCDVSIREFATVFPAGGSRTASVEVPPERLAELVSQRWVDVCKLPE